ncbi:hypothetical protein BH18ACT4_BH18ACT4_05240 [soil metagenome]
MWRCGEVRAYLLILAVAVFVAGCGDGAETTVTGASVPATSAGEPGDGSLAFGLRRCSAETQTATGAPEQYREEPVYVESEMPIEEVRAWASSKPDFEDIWIDRDHFGWITVAFSRGADQRQAELEAEFPGVGVVAVAVDWTAAELVALRDRAFAAMADAGFEVGARHSVSTGLVSVWVGELTQERLAPLAALAGPRMCVEGVDPDDVIRPGPQPQAGDGWRLLGTARTGPTYRTGVATDDDQYEALWDESGLGGEPPTVDFEREIVIWFAAVYGSGCEIRMNDVVLDTERAIVHGDFVVPGVHQGCAEDANPEAYVVAVQRDHLPDGRFVVQLGADSPPAGVPEERTVVDADLRSPGSRASDDEIGFDPALMDPVDPAPVIAAGGVLETGHPALYRLDLGCAFEVFGPINGITWRSQEQDLSANPPAAWTAVADSLGHVDVEVLLETDPPRLALTANGHTEAYQPVAGATSSCR